MGTPQVKPLGPLSADHQLALDLVARIRQDAERGVYAESLFKQVAFDFSLRLERHFLIEETSLAEVFASDIARALILRTRAEHAALRALLVEIRKGSTIAVRAFADLLEAHVHFEDQELYPAILSCLRFPEET